MFALLFFAFVYIFICVCIFCVLSAYFVYISHITFYIFFYRCLYILVQKDGPSRFLEKKDFDPSGVCIKSSYQDPVRESSFFIVFVVFGTRPFRPDTRTFRPGCYQDVSSWCRPGTQPKSGKKKTDSRSCFVLVFHPGTYWYQDVSSWYQDETSYSKSFVLVNGKVCTLA